MYRYNVEIYAKWVSLETLCYRIRKSIVVRNKMVCPSYIKYSDLTAQEKNKLVKEINIYRDEFKYHMHYLVSRYEKR